MERIQRGGRSVAGFGVGFGVGWNFPSEVNDLIKVSDARVKQLSDSFKAFTPKWIVADPIAYNDFVTDYVLFLARYEAAKNEWATSNTKYADISKAFRQNYPPDGAAETKGDWVDLYKRINVAQQATGAPPLIDRPPPDLANNQSNSIAMDFYRATAPFDYIAQITGEEAPHGPVRLAKALYDTARTQLNDAHHQIDETLDAIRWIKDHEKALVIGAVSLVAVAGGLYMAPIIKSYLPRTRREPEPE